MAGCDIGAMVVCLGAILGGWHVCTHFGVLHIKVTLPDAMSGRYVSVFKNKKSFVLSGVCFGVSSGVPFFTCVETQNCVFGWIGFWSWELEQFCKRWNCKLSWFGTDSFDYNLFWQVLMYFWHLVLWCSLHVLESLTFLRSGSSESKVSWETFSKHPSRQLAVWPWYHGCALWRFGCQPKNSGVFYPPKWMEIMEKLIKMGWFGGPTPIFGNTHFGTETNGSL